MRTACHRKCIGAGFIVSAHISAVSCLIDTFIAIENELCAVCTIVSDAPLRDCVSVRVLDRTAVCKNQAVAIRTIIESNAEIIQTAIKNRQASVIVVCPGRKIERCIIDHYAVAIRCAAAKTQISVHDSTIARYQPIVSAERMMKKMCI